MYRAYLGVFTSVVCGLLLVVVVFNAWTDPYDVGFPIAAGRLKEWRNTESNRVSKANRVDGRNWDFLILGSSREEMGLDPQSTVLADLGDGYNASLPGSNLYETRRVLEQAVKRSQPDSVFVGLSLVMFSAHRTAVDDFQRSDFASHPLDGAVENRLRRLLGWNTLRDSWSLWRRAQKDEKPMTDERGHRLPPREEGDARELSADLIRYYATDRAAYRDFQFSEDRWDDLRAIVNLSREREFRLYLFFSPVHPVQLETLVQLGLVDQVATMKRRAAEIVDEASRSGVDIQLWDFQDFRGAVAEPLPESGSGGRMRHFYEISHFRPVLGDLMIRAMLADVSGAQSLADGNLFFGVRLNSEIVGRHLEDLERFRAAYFRDHQEDRAWVAGQVRDATDSNP